QPEDVIAKYGRDVLRFYLLSSPAWDDFYFNWTDTENVSKTLNILRNTFNFIKTYVTKTPSEKPKLNVEDEWIISRLNSIILEYDNNLSNYNHHKSVNLLQDFILNDFSRWYIKLVRDRVWPNYEGKDKEAAFYTLSKVSEVLLKLLAPLTPHLAEQFYQDLIKKKDMPESIHLFNLPKVDKKTINSELEEQMKVAKMIFETSSAVRQKEKMKLKWPVKRMFIMSNNKAVKNTVNELKKLLENICNAKSVSLVTKLPKGKFSEGVFELGKLYIDLEVDQELYEEMLYRELTRTIQELRKKNKFVIKDEITLTLNSDSKTEKILKKFSEKLKHDVGAVSANVGELKGKYKGTLEFDDVKVEIAFDKK
ncbi:MAG: class I tRNA ligase family protein, partial [Fervidobacterium sp.]